MECPVVKGVYTIAMTTQGDTHQWCPNCKVFHTPSGEPTKHVDAVSDINEGRMVKRPDRGSK